MWLDMKIQKIKLQISTKKINKINQIMMWINPKKNRKCTAKSDAGGSDDAGLDDGVFLAGEGLLEEAALLEEGGPRLNDGEP